MMPYPMYNNQYYLNELQAMKDKIDSQIRQHQQQNQYQQPMQQPITQNFQLAPQTNNNELESKYAENIDEVKNTFVIKTGLFINKDYSTLWIKDVSGNIKTFTLEELVELDEKDREILDLQKQINELKGVIENANKSEHINSIVDESDGNKTTKRVSTSKKSNGK